MRNRANCSCMTKSPNDYDHRPPPETLPGNRSSIRKVWRMETAGLRRRFVCIASLGIGVLWIDHFPAGTKFQVWCVSELKLISAPFTK